MLSPNYQLTLSGGQVSQFPTISPFVLQGCDIIQHGDSCPGVVTQVYLSQPDVLCLCVVSVDMIIIISGMSHDHYHHLFLLPGIKMVDVSSMEMSGHRDVKPLLQ